MKSFWYLDLYWQWYLFFTDNLNTLTNIIFFWEKIKQIYIKKDNPLLSQVFQPKKPRARHGNKLNYLISHIVSVIAVQSGT